LLKQAILSVSIELGRFGVVRLPGALARGE